jgi:LacI family transcriptional regulator
MINKKIRIKDIAQLAGVSAGTVDRVLHNRGKVSEEALQKVQDTLQRIDYEPNLIARTLGSGKTYHIAVLIPDPTLDEYWNQSFAGINKAADELAHFGIYIQHFFFNLYDSSSFGSIAEAVCFAQPDGVLIAPVFYQEALPFFDLFKAKNIPCVLFNTNIPEADPLCFIGQNLFDSGKVGAELLHLCQNGSGTFALLHIGENSSDSVHLLEKEKGFRAYFKKNKLEDRVKVLNLENLKIPSEYADLENLLLRDDQLKGVLVSTSKGISFVSSILEKHGKRGIKLVGYDLLEENIKFLNAGVIDFLINQNPRRQAYLGINSLANFLFLKKSPPSLELFPLEIITRENLESYLKSGIY